MAARGAVAGTTEATLDPRSHRGRGRDRAGRTRRRGPDDALVVAQRLDVTATALYWHVKTKDDVLDLAVDRIFGDVAVPDASESWLEDIRVLARAWRGAMLDHPWAAGLIGRPMLGPNVLACTEFLQSALVRGRL